MVAFVVFEALPVPGYAAMCMLLWVGLVVYAALTFLGSTLVRSTAAGAGIGFLLLVVTGIVSALPTIGPYMPESLAIPARALALGTMPADVAGPLLANAGIIGGSALLAWVAFRRQEL